MTIEENFKSSKEFNPYIAAKAEVKLKNCENERRRNKLFASAIKLREQIIKSSRKLKSKQRTKGDLKKHLQLVNKLNELFELKRLYAEKTALDEYENALKELYEDTLNMAVCKNE